MTAEDTWSGAAARTLGAVLGAGALLLPAALAPRPVAVAALAGVLAGWCLLVAAAGGTRAGGPVAFVRDRLGPGPARVVTALYFGGFATGQAAVAFGAAGYALGSGDSGWRSCALAAGIVVTAAAAAWLSPRGLSTAAGRLRLAAVLALAVAWQALGGPVPGSGAGGWAVIPLLFGWVGLEGVIPALRGRRGAEGVLPSAPDAGRPSGGALGGTLLGLALAAALYAVLLRQPAGPATAPGPAAAALGLGSAALCWTYCRTNLQATAVRWTALTGRTRRGGVLAAALIALAALALGQAAHLGLAALLLGPGVATAALYCLIALAALRRPLPQEPTHDRTDHADRSGRVLEGAARPGR
ncbi:hypothetical protein ABZ128_01800 [Streptomyces sp. NPDC006326]|uniref:hypothetical protein n=1 Tax=Streptomyces sp. NPDC006326 TaxID=3156752 RepID=UPI0033A4540E